MTTTTPRSPGRPAIPRERIIDTAVQLVDEAGGDALTLRALAQRLNSGTATLYRHVSNRAELIGLVIERMLADIPTAEPEDDDARGWEAVCRDVATGVFTALTQHSRVAPLLVENFPTGPNAMALRERTLRALLRGGFEPETATLTVATIGRYALGFAMQSGGDQATSPQLSTAIDAERYPTMAAHSPLLSRQLGDEFEFGLSMILRGLNDIHPSRR